jgi:hypothetical protein
MVNFANKDARSIMDNVNTYSSPSQLRITDLRVAMDENHSEGFAPIVRIDTNATWIGCSARSSNSAVTADRAPAFPQSRSH